LQGRELNHTKKMRGLPSVIKWTKARSALEWASWTDALPEGDNDLVFPNAGVGVHCRQESGWHETNAGKTSHEPAPGQPGADGLEPSRGYEQRSTRPCLVVIAPALNGSQRIRRCYGQVSEAYLAAVDADRRLSLGLVPNLGRH
jgi:hypothetical protein